MRPNDAVQPQVPAGEAAGDCRLQPRVRLSDPLSRPDILRTHRLIVIVTAVTLPSAAPCTFVTATLLVDSQRIV